MTTRWQVAYLFLTNSAGEGSDLVAAALADSRDAPGALARLADLLERHVWPPGLARDYCTLARHPEVRLRVEGDELRMAASGRELFLAKRSEP